MTDSPGHMVERLRDLAARVERNVPQHRDPHAFHAEKSEIASELRRLANAAAASPLES